MAAKKNTNSTTVETPEALDLHALIQSGLKAEGITVKPKWSPTGSYASYYEGKTNIGYVFKQTRTGVRVEPAASTADLKGTKVKGYVKGKRSERFALVGHASDEVSVAQAVAVLALASAKAKAEPKPATKKAAPKRSRQAQPQAGESAAVTPNAVVVRKGKPMSEEAILEDAAKAASAITEAATEMAKERTAAQEQA